MVKNNSDTRRLFSVVIVGTIVLQLTSFIVIKNFGFEANNQLIFGSLGNNNLAIALSTLIMVVITYLFFQKKIDWVPTGLFIIGAMSNTLDRLIYRGVIDYINLPFIPSFNIADVLIVSAAVIVVISYISKDKRPPGL